MADFVEIDIEAGANFGLEITFQNDNGSAINLTNYTISSQLRKSYYSSSAVNFTITVSTPLDGLAEIDLSANTTANISPGRYVFDVLLVENTSQFTTRAIEGIATVLPRVTK